ncbi:bacterial alpha-L-rhamnosidase domain protein [Thozetella sp. PMI_491]|nr:bacterial alpha-L-rhamnosidase domain protein [Thozetella sp. PMI_491]
MNRLQTLSKAVGTSFLLYSHLVAAGSCWRDTPCSSITDAVFPGPWDSNIYAPKSRSVTPTSILSLDTGAVVSSYPGPANLKGNGSALVFDFGIEVGGVVTIRYTVTGTGSGALGLAFTEAKDWIGEWSDDSNGSQAGRDGAIYSNFTGPGEVVYAMPDEKLRGGFRYLTLFLMSQAAAATIDDVSLEIGFQPTWSNLRAYQGYFHSNDDELNKIWYSGAYTVQTNAVPVDTGRQAKPFLTTGWANNGTLGPGNTIIVDGAKRDRAVWPGDMGVAVPATFVSIGDLESVKNALQVMYDYQDADGSFPEAGPPLLQKGSDTYHMWTMIGTYNYVLYTNDTEFLLKNWKGYLGAMSYVYGKVQPQPSGLLNVTGVRDWARWQTGFNMSEAQMILYRTLTTGASLAQWAGDTTGLSATWSTRATALQNATLTWCYDAKFGAFRDNATQTALHPQDANSLALWFGVVDSTSPEAQSISTRLLDNWTPIGAETPELPGNISPFISSFEITGHLTVGQTQRALELIRRCWGWYLRHPNGTQSTVVEGYLTNGTWGYRWNRGYGNDPSYVSHAHGWSAGPTSVLTEYILGLRVTERAGSKWQLAPQFGDLKDVQGGFATSLGKYQAHWTKAEGAYSATLDTPAGTSGELILPVLEQGVKPKVVIDGKSACPKWYRRSEAGDLVVLIVTGGRHTIQVS